MARRSIFTQAPESGTFASRLPVLDRELVDANAPAAHRLTGRTADALQKLREAARAEGFESGYAEGRIEGIAAGRQAVEEETSAAIASFCDELQAKADQVLFAYRQFMAESEDALAELAVLVASRALAQELRLGHDAVTALAKEAIAEVLHASQVRIRVHPFDVPTLAERKDELLAAARQLRSIEIVEDPSILGGCVIESDAGLIDATVSTKLAAMSASLREAA